MGGAAPFCAFLVEWPIAKQIVAERVAKAAPKLDRVAKERRLASLHVDIDDRMAQRRLARRLNEVVAAGRIRRTANSKILA